MKKVTCPKCGNDAKFSTVAKTTFIFTWDEKKKDYETETSPKIGIDDFEINCFKCGKTMKVND